MIREFTGCKGTGDTATYQSRGDADSVQNISRRWAQQDMRCHEDLYAHEMELQYHGLTAEFTRT